MSRGIIGRKIGMTQVFDETGRLLPVTVIEAGPCRVVQRKTAERDGYDAIQIGFGEIHERRLNRPLRGHFKKSGVIPHKLLKEFPVSDSESNEVGQVISIDVFSPGDRVDITGTSIGKGFSGVIKRHGFHRGPMSHGSKYHRRVGSLGASSQPSRVFKGRRMPGRMGGERTTIQGLELVRVDPERNLLLVKGAVPGVRGSYVSIRSAVKGRA